MVDAHQEAESGQLEGRYEWVEEPQPMAIPEDPEWSIFSNRMRQWTANPGAILERDDALGTPDAVGHSRGAEEPEAVFGYDMQRFPVDETGYPQSPEGYAGERDDQGRIFASLLCVGRTKDTGGNLDSGLWTYTVIRGVKFETVTAICDPSEVNPILIEAEALPTKVRSYVIHQPDEPYAIQAVSSEPTEDEDLTITFESEDAETVEEIDMGETTTETFDNLDVFWMSDNPVGDITIEYVDDEENPVDIAVEGTSYETEDIVAGGLTYSDDEQPVDGDRGIPPLGDGSHDDEIDSSLEYFIGDRVEREEGVPYRPRINTLEWIVENEIEQEPLHVTRAPSNDMGERNVMVEGDIAGKRASHDSMMDSLQKVSFPLYHQLSGGVVEFPSLVIQEGGEREYEGEGQAVAAVEETLEATDGAGIVFHNGATIEEVVGE